MGTILKIHCPFMYLIIERVGCEFSNCRQGLASQVPAKSEINR